MYCCFAGSTARSLRSGCENANCTPDCMLGSKLKSGLVLVVRAASHETLHVPDPQGMRCRTPVDEKKSRVTTPPLPSRKFDAGVLTLDRPSVDDNCGV